MSRLIIKAIAYDLYLFIVYSFIYVVSHCLNKSSSYTAVAVCRLLKSTMTLIQSLIILILELIKSVRGPCQIESKLFYTDTFRVVFCFFSSLFLAELIQSGSRVHNRRREAT